MGIAGHTIIVVAHFQLPEFQESFEGNDTVKVVSPGMMLAGLGCGQILVHPFVQEQIETDLRAMDWWLGSVLTCLVPGGIVHPRNIQWRIPYYEF